MDRLNFEQELESSLDDMLTVGSFLGRSEKNNERDLCIGIMADVCCKDVRRKSTLEIYRIEGEYESGNSPRGNLGEGGYDYSKFEKHLDWILEIQDKYCKKINALKVKLLSNSHS